MTAHKGAVPLIVALFASGVAGLLYETLWARYLGLLLGHAAWAQSMVLALYMGGMALGAALTSSRIGGASPRRLIVVFAGVEALLGALAVSFPSVFDTIDAIAYTTVLPTFGPAGVWVLGAALVLPGAIALGATWPLASAAIAGGAWGGGVAKAGGADELVRAVDGAGADAPTVPADPGAGLGAVGVAWIYAANTLGAAVGAVACGPLVAALDLDGALRAAGGLDLLVAVYVLGLARWAGLAGTEGRGPLVVEGSVASQGGPAPTPSDPHREVARGGPEISPAELGSPSLAGPGRAPGPYVHVHEQRGEGLGQAAGSRTSLRPIFLAAALTGLASFAYEIAWTRMLALVLGSSTRAFELMLATFLVGLAAGGLLVRGRLTTNVVARLGRVQVGMGLAALASLPLYHVSFDAMVALSASVERTDAGWYAWSLGSAGIAAIVMLPATLLAGMTLPLLSAAVLERGGAADLGRVWAANTVGSIAGVLLAVHVGLPMLGVADVVRAGAAVDLAVGVALLGARPFVFAIAAFALGVSALTPVSATRMASGVYRTGALLPADAEVVYAADGRTASVALTREGALWSLRTNGKPDAAIRLDDTPAFDEPTMVLLGALPLLLHPDARRVANVGLGSGLTTHTLLADPAVEVVDTVEIEPAMIEASRHFGDRVARTFADPRSHLHVADARTVFAARAAEPYDVLVSEPSNPWVSGVAGLFSKEHYARSRAWLAPGGLLVQWLQAYEIDERLLASVLSALTESYPEWEVWAANGGDLLVIASRSHIPAPASDFGALAPDLARVGVHSASDLALRRIGGRGLLEPLFAATNAPANSERAPLLELEAPRALFLGAAVPELAGGGLDALPLTMLECPACDASVGDPTWTMDVPRVPHRSFGRLLAGYFQGGAWEWPHADDPLPAEARTFADQARAALRCEPQPLGAWVDGMFNSFALRALPHMGRAEVAALLEPAAACASEPIQLELLGLFRALSRHDAPAMSQNARAVLGRVAEGDDGFLGWLLGAAMLGEIAQGHTEAARALWATESARIAEETRANITLRLLRAHAEERRFGAR